MHANPKAISSNNIRGGLDGRLKWKLRPTMSGIRMKDIRMKDIRCRMHDLPMKW